MFPILLLIPIVIAICVVLFVIGLTMYIALVKVAFFVRDNQALIEKIEGYFTKNSQN